ncbi:cytochrome c oxidase subunit 3 [Marivirga atlantica]|jgi:cytochrome c oxidase subunit 3|uniref:Cytochrome c oxidase subunit 3 n=1 Tax=Marivirga atlantica TaxID=1548457 RepID=A0A937ADC1_9BACT|nr:cytochrome c oxidase subunit 3 [Marivirga atlantica]MBL0764168.1 cytochrome c oxidase subunit 3 [Marivirga atlantica]
MEKRTKQDLSFFERVERMHPYKMILILGLFGSSLIFLFLLISFFVSLSNVEEVNVEVPSIFIISTILIISSSYFINPIRKLFKANAHKALVTTMRYTFLLGVGFAFCQLMGYRELIESGNLFNSGIASSFLYILTGLHALHFIAAHTYLGVLIFQTKGIMRDPIKYLMAETNPYWHLKYELLTKVWHFLGVLWMILIISFWVFL